MLSVLAAGTLIRDPKAGTSTAGTQWANTTIRCATGQDREGATLTSFLNVIAFGDEAAKLATLTKGDTVSVTGNLKQTEYVKDGETRHGLEITASAVMSTYQARKKADQPKTQAEAYRDFAKRPTARY